MDMESLVYVNYEGRVEISLDLLFVVAWNKLIEEEGYGNKISLNNKEFFETSFNNLYDVAWATSYGNYRWADDYVYFNTEGHLISFSHWDDENSPIDIDRIDISSLAGLQDLQRQENNCPISRAIQKALDEI